MEISIKQRPNQFQISEKCLFRVKFIFEIFQNLLDLGSILCELSSYLIDLITIHQESSYASCVNYSRGLQGPPKHLLRVKNFVDCKNPHACVS